MQKEQDLGWRTVAQSSTSRLLTSARASARFSGYNVCTARAPGPHRRILARQRHGKLASRSRKEGVIRDHDGDAAILGHRGPRKGDEAAPIPHWARDSPSDPFRQQVKRDCQASEHGQASAGRHGRRPEARSGLSMGEGRKRGPGTGSVFPKERRKRKGGWDGRELKSEVDASSLRRRNKPCVVW